MNIPKISIPKIDMASIKENAKTAFAKGKTFVMDAPKNFKALAQDTVEFAKANPKKAGLIAVATAAVLTAGTSVANFIKDKVESVKGR